MRLAIHHQCAFQLAQKLNYKTGIARSLRNIGLIDARRGNVAMLLNRIMKPSSYIKK